MCTTQFLFLYDGLWWKWLFTLKNVSKNDWKLIIGGVGIKMSWVEKNREINNLGGTVIRDSRVIKSSHTFGIFKKTIEFRIYVLWKIKLVLNEILVFKLHLSQLRILDLRSWVQVNKYVSFLRCRPSQMYSWNLPIWKEK